MTRSRPEEFEFAAHDDPELLARMAEVAAGGTGWINVVPLIDEEHQPPAPGPVRLPGWLDPQGAHATWMPGKHAADGTTSPTTVGAAACGRSPPGLEAPRLRSHRCPRAGGSPRTIRAGAWWPPVPPAPRPARSWTGCCDWPTVVCTVPSTGRWKASVHPADPREGRRGE